MTEQRLSVAQRAGPAPDGTAFIVPQRRPGHLGSVGLAQMLLVEGFVVTTLALLEHVLLAVVVAAIGLLTTIALFARAHGRWWLLGLLLRRRYRRRRPAVLGVCADSRLSAIRGLAPELTVQGVHTSDDASVGVGQDAAGWFAAIEVSTTGDVAKIPVDRLIRALADAGQPGVVLQVLVQTVPAPSGTVDTQHRAPTSYRQLLQTQGVMLAAVTTWVVVRLNSRIVAGSVTDPRQLDDVPTMLVALLRRVGRVLDRARITHRMLDVGGLLEALAGSCDMKPAESGEPVSVPREAWRTWSSARLDHVAFWVSHWSSPEAGMDLLRRLRLVPASTVAFSLTAMPLGEGGTEIRCLVRVAARETVVDAAVKAVEQTAQQAGLRVFRLDGEQAVAVYATIPTGGGMG